MSDSYRLPNVREVPNSVSPAQEILDEFRYIRSWTLKTSPLASLSNTTKETPSMLASEICRIEFA